MLSAALALSAAPLASAAAPIDDARKDALDGRWDDATARYRAILASNPDDAEARGGLVDVLTWQREYDEAFREADAGLALRPDDAGLLARRGRIHRFRGDVAKARADLDRAEALAPNDRDIRDIADRVILGEGRIVLRNELFPSSFDQDHPSMEAIVTQRVDRFTIGARTFQGSLYPDAAGNRRYNALYAASGAYTFAPGWTGGVEAGFGAPARAIPRIFGRGFLWFPLPWRFDGYVSYTVSGYSGGTTLNMVNPILGLQVHDAVRVDGRGWFGVVTAPGTTEVVGAAGGSVTWSATSRLSFDALYIYGRELSYVPDVFQLAAVRSHVLSLGADVRLARHFGLRPRYQLEARTLPSRDVIDIHTAELGAYVRW